MLLPWITPVKIKMDQIHDKVKDIQPNEMLATETIFFNFKIRRKMMPGTKPNSQEVDTVNPTNEETFLPPLNWQKIGQQ